MKKRILFVDDDPLLLQVYAMMLGDVRDHWEVVTMEDPKKALELMEHSAFDVVVSDMHMPRMNGIELDRRGQKAISARVANHPLQSRRPGGSGPFPGHHPPVPREAV